MGKKPSESAVVEFGRSVGRLVRRARAEGAPNDLSWTETEVLVWVSKHGPETTAELARLQGMKPQSMGTVVAGLEEKGLVTKTPHETDGRRMYVVLTEKGAALRKSTTDVKRAWIAKVIATLSDEEQAILFEAGRLMRRMVEGEGQ